MRFFDPFGILYDKLCVVVSGTHSFIPALIFAFFTALNVYAEHPDKPHWTSDEISACDNITALKIYDQSDDQPVSAIGAISDGMTIDVNDLPSNYYLVVETGPDVGSVEIILNGTSQGEENNALYTWPNNDNNWNGGLGSYTLEATAYEEDGYSGSLCDQINIQFDIVQNENCGDITALKIYDQSNDQPVSAIGAISDGMNINIDDLPSNYYLVVETDSDIDDVSIELNNNTQSTEGEVPYTWPNAAENDNNWNGGLGTYTVDATAYDSDGNTCDIINIQFDIIQSSDCGDITSVELYDSADDQPISGIDPLGEGVEVNVSDLPGNYYINVLVSGGVESVEIELDGNSQNEENQPPYTWPNTGSNWNAGVGTYTIDATAYENSSYSGDVCDQVNFTFSIVDGAIDANNDNATVSENNTALIDILSNDNFGDAGPASDYVTITSQPYHGTAQIIPNGSGPSDDELEYIPDSNYGGTDQIEYEICDADGNCATATVTITVEMNCQNTETVSGNIDLPCLQNRHFTVQTKALLNASNLCMTIPDTSTVKNVYVEVYTQESDCGGTLPNCMKISADGTVYKNPDKIDVIDHPSSGVPEAMYRVKLSGSYSQICIVDDEGCNLSSMALYIDREGGSDATGEVVLVDEELYDIDGEDYCIGNDFSINESGSDREVNFSVPMHESTVAGAEYKIILDGYDEEDNLVYEDEHTTTAPDASGVFLYTITRTIPGPVTNIHFSVCNPDGTTETIGIGMVGISSTNSCDLIPEVGEDESIDNIPGEATTVDILDNDVDLDGSLDASTVNVVSSPPGSTASDTDGDGDIDELIIPDKGTWTVDDSDGSITFTPEPGFGDSPDPLYYTVQDDSGNVSDNGSVTVSYNQALPVLLTYFNVNKTTDQEAASIKWGTSLETGFSHYKIQRSNNGINYQFIGQIDPDEHNSRSIREYQFIDDAPEQGINYYRLKMVDEDQSFDLSDVKSLVFDRTADDTSIRVYPSPTDGALNVEHQNMESGGLLLIVNTLGEVVYEQNVRSNSKQLKELLDLRQLTSGTYRLVIIDGENVHSTTFLVRRRH